MARIDPKCGIADDGKLGISSLLADIGAVVFDCSGCDLTLS